MTTPTDLLHPIPYANEHGQGLCPLPLVEWDYTDDSEDLQPLPPRTCAGDLYVVWSYSSPFGPGDRQESAEGWAISWSWRVECSNGHVLRVSSNQATGRDDAEPADWGVLFLGVVRDEASGSEPLSEGDETGTGPTYDQVTAVVDALPPRTWDVTVWPDAPREHYHRGRLDAADVRRVVAAVLGASS
jgi:hypothetical protein